MCVQSQNNIPCIWAEVGVDKKKEARTFEIFGTGHIIPEPKGDEFRHYIGTFQIENGSLVFHLYEYFYELPF